MLKVGLKRVKETVVVTAMSKAMAMSHRLKKFYNLRAAKEC